MARLNTRPSNAQSARFDSETPSVSFARMNGSDDENLDPDTNPRKVPARRSMESQSRSATPLQATRDGVNAQKRKHQDVGHAANTEEERLTRYYDSNQDWRVRREVKRESRALERDFNEKRDELLRDSGIALKETVDRANNIFKKVKQTGDATVDSRLLVSVSDLGKKKAAQMVLGDASTGIDVDEFLSKCITFMRVGADGNPTLASTRRDETAQGEDGEESEGTTLDWARLGRMACFPNNRRPPVPTFLLGPLSVEKKHRTQTQRRARQARDTNTREARPEAVTREDLSQTDENGLTAVCTKIRNRLAAHLKNAETALTHAGIRTQDDLTSERGRALLRKHRLADNGAVPLFDFVVNPHSFGQTVENLFYVSFLIKEGSVGVEPDADGLPTLSPARPSTLEEQRQKDQERAQNGARGSNRSRSNKHQAVLALDYGTWQQLIEAFEIHEPMIPHRQEEAPTQLGATGWYT